MKVAHFDVYATCKHCGRRQNEHARDTRKCLFEATVYAPFQLTSFIDNWFIDESKKISYRETKEQKHKTSGGVGSVGRLRNKR